ncbi:L,D-transpeptidase family protein [Bacillus sp. SJS]|uniref:L,D-transpeptidase family protein n=1 Tax=Bacillus sp. SJS TaxID=1423321 RepID=UPI00068D3E7D|nr:L,D-transpeptidase family protein [Bacillus sp. SJS]KZZ83304.1 hypothetical protein AS29_016240 [Bacillus sp. SJS]
MKKITLSFVLIFSFLLGGHVTPASASGEQLLIVNKAINKLAFFNNGKLVRVFSIGTGRSDDLTPEGTFRVVTKIMNRPYYKDNIPGGDPRNPLGDRWLGLDARGTYGTTYAIHGNNNENSIGHYVSSGCIRMHNSEVRWLYPQVDKMTKAVILKSSESFETIAEKNGYSLNADYSRYAAADSQGKILFQKTAQYQTAVNTGSISKVNGLYDGLTNELKKAESLIGKVSGKSNRDELGKKYLNPAKKTVERSIYEISQFRLMNSIKADVSAKNSSKAESKLQTLNRLKNRAVQIKKAGGYPPLPAPINRSLESQEASLYGMMLQIRTADYNKSITSSNLISIDSQYNRVSAAIAQTEKQIGEVYGSANRDSLLKLYVKPAKIARERTIYQVSMHRLMNKIDALVKSGSTSKAAEELRKLERLQDRSIEIQKDLGYPLLKTIDESLNKRYIELNKKLG